MNNLNKSFVYGLVIAVMVCKTSSMSHAQPVTAPNISEYTIKVTPQELDTIGKGLGKVPYEEVSNLLQKLRQQVIEQQTAVSKPADKSKDEAPSQTPPK